MVNVVEAEKKGPVTRTDNVIDRLRSMVLDGLYSPGSHLQETRLAEALGVSRTPVRDALRVLGQEGLLTYAPNRGYFVSDMSDDYILDAYEVRATLEGMGCRLCSKKGLTTEVLNTLESIMEKCQEILDGKRDELEWGGLNTDFHLAIVEASNNMPLLSATRQMRRIPRLFDSRLQPKTAFFRSVYNMERHLKSHAEHIAIFEAIKSGQSARAEFLMREHVYQNRAALKAKLEKDGQHAV